MESWLVLMLGQAIGFIVGCLFMSDRRAMSAKGPGDRKPVTMNGKQN